MTDLLPPTPLPLAGGPDAIHPDPALDQLTGLRIWAVLRTWTAPHQALGIRSVARQLAAGHEPDRALYGALLDSIRHHCQQQRQSHRQAP
jgi:hypothetical protein